MSDTAIQHPNVRAALIAAQAEFGVVAKSAENPFFKSKYADLPAVMAEAQPVLARHGLAVIQQPSFEVIDGKVYDTLKTTVIHNGDNGGFDNAISSEMVLKPVKSDPQAQGSAITYARRYSYMAVLGLVADVDDDGNAASAPAKPKASRAKAAPKSAPSDADGVDQAELNAAIADVKAAAKEAGASIEDVAALFLEKTGTALIASRNIPALKRTAEHYREELAKKALGATEVAPE